MSITYQETFRKNADGTETSKKEYDAKTRAFILAQVAAGRIHSEYYYNWKDEPEAPAVLAEMTRLFGDWQEWQYPKGGVQTRDPRFYDKPVSYYEGLVLDDRERNGRDDSDFYAVIWNPEEKRCFTVEYATTRFGGGGHCRVDATEEVILEAEKWLASIVRPSILAQATKKAKEIEKGDRVKVVKGRKTPVGTEGIVFWIGEGQKFGYYSPIRHKVGIATSDRKDDRGRAADVAWTYLDNCEKVGWESLLPSPEEIDRRAEEYGRGRCFAAPFVAPGYFFM